MATSSSSRKRSRKKVTCCPSPSSPPAPSPSPPPSPAPSPSPSPLPAPEEKRLGTLQDLDLLSCPVCFGTFSDLIFQCDNGHLACSTCCTKLRNKCPNCTLPIGNIRCRAMENIVESITVPCPNSIFGCSEIFSYKYKKTHEKECLFSQCFCPLQDCNYKGHYKDLYQHFDTTHESYNIGYRWYVCGTNIELPMQRTDNIYVLKEVKKCLLFVVQWFKVENGMFVNVSCVAPLGVELDEFSYRFYILGMHTIRYESPVIKRIQEVKFEIPQENFMFIPSFITGEDGVNMRMELNLK